MVMIVLGVICFILSFIISLDDENSNILIWFICVWGSLFLIAGIFLRIPTAMDLHTGKAVIKYEVVDGIKVDSTFVFKNN